MGTAGEARTNSQVTFFYGPLHIDVSARNYLHHLCADTRFSLEDLSSVMDDRDGWRKKDSRKAVLSAPVEYDYIYVYRSNSCCQFLYLSHMIIQTTHKLAHRCTDTARSTVIR